MEKPFVLNLDGDYVLVDVIVTPGFVLTEFAAIIDALRTANRVTPRTIFRWKIRSQHGGDITSSSAAIVRTEPFEAKPDVTYLFVVGNTDQDCPDLSMGGTIRRYTQRGARVFLLAEAASRYIEEQGSKAAGLSTHWENSAVLRERSGLIEASDSIASVKGSIVTCAGMGTTLDVVLAVIGQHIPAAALVTLANIFLHEKIRDFDTRQPFAGTSGNTTGDALLDRAISLMRTNMEEPLSISDIVEEIGVSDRSLERRFRAVLNSTPVSFYRQLRLSQANNLLVNTSLPIREVGLACGFPNGFSVTYRAHFGMTPLERRKQRKR